MTIDSERRHLLKAGGLAVSTGILAGLGGCSGGVLGGGNGGDTDPLSVVPAAADNVAYVDVAGILEDSGIETLVNTFLELAAEQPSYEGPTTKEEALEQFQSESNLDPTKAESLVGFSKYGRDRMANTRYGGAWYSAEWSEEDVVAAIENQETGTELEERSYAEHTVYAPASEFGTTWIGVVADGEYAIGTEEAVKDVIDVVEGDDEGVSDTLREAYESARSGLVKSVATVPDDRLPTGGIGSSTSFDVAQLNKVEVSTFVLYHDGGGLGVESTLQTGSSDDAEDVRNVIAGALSASEGMVEQYSEALVGALDSVEVSQDGDTVTVSYSSGVSDLADLIETVFEDLQSMETGTGTMSVVTVSPHRPAVERAIDPLGTT